MNALKENLDHLANHPQSTDSNSNLTCSPKVLAANQDRIDAPHHFDLDSASRLDTTAFPNPPHKKGHQLSTTIPNVNHLLKSYGITVRYNVIKKKLTISMPGHSGSPDNFDNVAMTQIISLANLNGMAAGSIPNIVEAIGDRNQYNPAAVWILLKKWDGVDRLPDLCATLTESEGFPHELKAALVYRWTLSVVAAALKPSGFRCRGVLTLQGPQGIGKTAWTKALVPEDALSQEFIKLDHHLDAGNKDSLLGAIAYWIVEIGELDSSFRKDVARLKGLLTAKDDSVRRPYARTESTYQRRTVFCATVNDANFLVDTTGNTRWWTLPVVSINYMHGIDMQQLFAQLAEDFNKGIQWWLTPEEEQMLDLHNKAHRSVSALRERILDAIILAEKTGDIPIMARTATEVLDVMGIKNPSNAQCKECGSVLREVLGTPKRIQGRDKWRVQFREIDNGFIPQHHAFSGSNSTAEPPSGF